ncbi:serine hydrolase domain-containing protein [Qipengyuania sphaerica]|uniref:serine hydrolase domain-containing protein n=1 Tax=Qipengyuania sphaerica TaxID=2867243 RepID=UPI001C881909|nr:serine hydrolase [Qipengyuania sphaerica]MBX7541468.1 beta-lactamase family protein [Qipengyuania sphaerica]
MFHRSHSLIALALATTSLVSCGSPGPAEEPPLSEEALASVTSDAGAPSKALAREVDDLFRMEGLGETRALIVMKDGKIAAERYAEGYDKDTRLISWSMAKTVTAIMIGQLVGDGLLRLDQPAPVPRWQRSGDPRADITLRHLLQMRSGLEHTEMVDPLPDADMTRMLFLDGRDDMADYATAKPPEAEAGEKFVYSSATTVILADIAARVLADSDQPEARRRAVSDYLHARLFDPLGATSMVPEFDRAGTLIGGSLMHATARDWAKLGELLRNKGSYRGEQLVPRSWVAEMVKPSPKSPQYGLQTWLNRPTGEAEHPLFPDRAPHSAFSMIGHMGQYVFVSPEQGLTIVRLGHSNREERIAMLQQLADVVELYPSEGR